MNNNKRGTMRVINSIQFYANYGLVAVFQVAGKIASDTNATKKLGQVILEIIKGVDLVKGNGHLPDFVRNIKGNIELIDLYDMANNFKYWASPFDTKRIDQGILSQSLNDALNNLRIPNKRRKKNAEEITKEVMETAKSAKNHAEFYKVLKTSLKNQGYTDFQVEKFIEKAKINIKSRPLMEVLNKLCSTSSNFGTNLITLQKWKLVNLAELASNIGSQMPLLRPLFVYSIESTVKFFSVSGQAINSMNAIYNLGKIQFKIMKSQSDKSLEGMFLKRKQALWDIAANGTDLVNTVLPIFVSLNPPILIGMALITKGTGLLCILCKP